MAGIVRCHRTGGPDVLVYEQTELPPPGPGEVAVRQTAIGLNFVDTYFRSGINAVPSLPFTPGNEAVGIVDEVGEGVTEVAVGDRAGYATIFGAYAERRLVKTDQLLRLPDGIDDRTAAASLLKGMTAQYLLRQCFRVERGHRILVHAAAGALGQILCQWASHLGAHVIGTVGSPEKAAIAEANCCRDTILYREEDVAERVQEITDGARCDVVYDGIGRATFPASLDCLKPRGLFVSLGHASGPIEAFDIRLLLQKGSLYATRPTLANFTATRADLVATATEFFEAIERGVVKAGPRQSFQLSEAAAAHRALENRETVGASILIP